MRCVTEESYRTVIRPCRPHGAESWGTSQPTGSGSTLQVTEMKSNVEQSRIGLIS